MAAPVRRLVMAFVIPVVGARVVILELEVLV
jgi:hypothetical protein